MSTPNFSPDGLAGGMPGPSGRRSSYAEQTAKVAALVAAKNWAPGLWLLDHGLLSPTSRYTVVVAVTLAQLLAYHLWLAAGRRNLWDVWPGAVLSVALWILAASIYSWWLTVSDYSIFYAGLTQLLTALIFFQVSGIIMVFGAEYNRALAEARAGG